MFTDEDNNIIFLAEGCYVEFDGKWKYIILNPNQSWISIFTVSCECFGIGINTHGIETNIPLELDVEKWWCEVLIK